MSEEIDNTVQIERAHEVLSGVLYGPEMNALSSMFGYEGHAFGAISSEHLGQLEEFAKDKWDFRGGKERWEAGVAEFTAGQTAEIFGLTSSIAGHDLVHSTMTDTPADAVLVLGGGNNSGLLRIQYAEQFIDATDSKPNMYLLGSARIVGDKERPKTDVFAPGAVTEFDLMNAAIKNVYDGAVSSGWLDTSNISIEEAKQQLRGSAAVAINDENTPETDDPEYWAVQHYRIGDMLVRSLLAPQIEGSRRANTADTMRMLRERYGDKLAGKNVVSSTQSVYSLFQDIDLLKMVGIPLGANTKTIGFSAEYAGVERTPGQLLQEVLSAIKSARRLDNSLSQQ